MTPPPANRPPHITSAFERDDEGNLRRISMNVIEADGSAATVSHPPIRDVQHVVITPSVRAPAWVDVEARNDQFIVRLHVIPRPAAFFVERVAVTSADDGSPVTGEVLRGIPVASLVRFCRYTLSPHATKSLANTAISTEMLGGWVPPHIVEQWPDGRTDAVLDVVALLYRVANAVGEGPTQAVAKGFGVSRATAGRMVSQARVSGLIPPEETAWRGGRRGATPENGASDA